MWASLDFARDTRFAQTQHNILISLGGLPRVSPESNRGANRVDPAGFEPAIFRMQTGCSTTELQAHLWARVDSNHGPRHYQ